MQAATKHYVDAQAAISLPISGGTLTGPLALPSNPASALQAAPKQYVDSQIAYALPLAGGTLSGALILPGDPTTALQAATKHYVDSSAFYSVTSLAPVTTIAGSDLVAISQGGTDHSISYANLLDGMTIDVASTAAPASDTDLFWVGQGSSTMLAQTFATVWTWIKGKLQTYRRPVVEISINTTLDGTIHNGAILICSQPITLTPAFPNMGSGFTCSVVNVSGGNVTFACRHRYVIRHANAAHRPGGRAPRIHLLGRQRRVRGHRGRRAGTATWPGDRPRRRRRHTVQRCADVAGTGDRRRGNWLHGQLSGDFGWRCLDIAECRRNKPDRQRPCGGDAI